jgi:hypothetical protein
MLDDFDDEYDNDDPWDFDSSKNQKKPEPAKPQQEKKEEPKKKNPFESDVKPAFDDLDDIDFGLDSDRNAKKKDEPKAKQEVSAKKGDSKKRNDTDNGLFVDNDFGDEYDYDDEDFEQDDEGKDNIFENSRTKEAAKPTEEKKAAPVL